MPDRDHRLVVVIDDHELSQRLIEQVLVADGFDVRCADSIAGARPILARRAPAALVLDLQLPDGSGLELALSCRRDPRLRSCAILACSAGYDDEDERRALSAGCDAYVGKPIDVHEFAQQLRELLAARQPDDGALSSAASVLEPGGRAGASR
jgi:CheY-like chemotaxis protein